MKRVLLALCLVAILGGLYLISARRVAGRAGLPLDDAWIHARIARNVASGKGFSFNPGESAAASSAPLWTLLLALPVAAGAPFPAAAFGTGMIAAMALVAVAWRLAEKATGDRSAALLCAVLMAGTHPFPWASLSGMETSLAATLVLGAILAASSGRTGVSLAVAATAGCTRPELTLLPGLVLLDWLCRTRPLRLGKALGVTSGAFLAAISPFLCNRILTGRWLFESFEAKVGRHGILAALAEGRSDLLPGIVSASLRLYLLPLLEALLHDNGALLILAPVGLWCLARGEHRSHLPWMVGLLLPFAMATLAPFGGPLFHEQRYVAPIVAVMVVSGSSGLSALGSFVRQRGARVALAFVVVAWSFWGSWRGMERYAREVKNINEMQVRIGLWIAAHGPAPGGIATNDIGAIGYFTGAPIVDTTGLASPEVIPFLRRPPPAGIGSRGWNGANEAGLLEFLRARSPEYVAIFPSWYPSRFFQEALGSEVFRVELDDNLICGDRTMIVYRPRWDRAERSP